MPFDNGAAAGVFQIVEPLATNEAVGFERSENTHQPLVDLFILIFSRRTPRNQGDGEYSPFESIVPMYCVL